MDKEKIFNHKIRNLFHTIVLIAGMGGLMALLGYLMAGVTGIYWSVLLALGILTFGQVSPKLILKIQKARALSPYEAPELFDLIRELAYRAGLSNIPKLYYVPSRSLNAFALGSKQDAYIGITAGLINTLNMNEMAGVLAHEMSHIKNNDMRVMSIARLFHQITNSFSTIGKIMLFLSLPLLVFGYSPFSFVAILLLLFAPTISDLMQMALSRTREFEADLDAARLTGDPNDLASALKKLDYYTTNPFTRLFGKANYPEALSTHPATKERVRRLMELYKTENYHARTGYFKPNVRVIYPKVSAI
ncbi:MAG: zinc metalloprotease HtpX [Flammeovirgaceae bacterium]